MEEIDHPCQYSRRVKDSESPFYCQNGDKYRPKLILKEEVSTFCISIHKITDLYIYLFFKHI